MTDWRAGGLAGWPAACAEIVPDWMAGGRSVAGPAAWLAGWLAGPWLAGWPARGVPPCKDQTLVVKVCACYV